MKNSKLRRALMLVACVVALVSLSVGATLAYLTAQTNIVTNTFTVGKVSFDASAGLDEAKVNAYGEKVNADGKTQTEAPTGWTEAVRVTKNSYKLIPGHEYVKDPTVHIGTDSEDGYLFVRVVNGIADIEATGNTTIAKQMENKGWIALNNAQYPNVYYKADPVSKGADVVVFESFTLADNADVANYENATITIQAYLVQADGFTNTTSGDPAVMTPAAVNAWNAAPLAAWEKVTTPAGGEGGE